MIVATCSILIIVSAIASRAIEYEIKSNIPRVSSEIEENSLSCFTIFFNGDVVTS